MTSAAPRISARQITIVIRLGAVPFGGRLFRVHSTLLSAGCADDPETLFRPEDPVASIPQARGTM